MKIENYQAADFLPLTADKPTKPGFYVAEISPEKWLVCVWRKENGQLMTKIGGKTCKVDKLKASWCPLLLQADLTQITAERNSLEKDKEFLLDRINILSEKLDSAEFYMSLCRKHLLKGLKKIRE